MDPTAVPAHGDRATVEPAAAALAGLVAVAVGAGSNELLAGLVPTVPSLVVGVAERVIDAAPARALDVAIAIFGRHDKAVLVGAVVVVTAALGGLVGLAARRRPRLCVSWLLLVAVVSAAAAARQPAVSGLAALVGAGLAWSAASVTLTLLLRLAGRPAKGAADGAGVSRRAFLAAAGATAALAAASAVAGRLVVRTTLAVAARARVVLPRPSRAAPAIPAEASLAVAGISPLVTPNRRFYRIDTSLVVPDVDVDTWRLELGGRVERPFELSFDELLSLPLEEADITLACVSNLVGGSLVGTARWLGVPLARLLERAGVGHGADQVVGRSVDGFTTGFPLAAAIDGRPAMVAVGMNGEPLPLAHGFPARLIVPGLYGYVSATKWLRRIELTRLADFDAYWARRGWAKQAPIKTECRIDVPRPYGQVPGGLTAIAGVAWAPTRGISAVEVQVDEGPWLTARLAAAVNDDTWRQWVFSWDARPGRHVVRARAVDGRGRVQEAERRPPRPDGASGYPALRVRVAANEH